MKSEHKNQRNQKEKRGKGVAYLAVVHRRAGKRKGPPGGTAHRESGHRGAAARPLDDDVLTRWGTRTPARGPAMAPWLTAPPFSLALGCARLAAV